jgi:hypothetical protein
MRGWQCGRAIVGVGVPTAKKSRAAVRPWANTSRGRGATEQGLKTYIKVGGQ